jgi:hypothetical protein
MNWSNLTSRITGNGNSNAYNSNNYEEVAFKRYEPKFRNDKPHKDDWASLAMKHITTKGANGDETYDEISKIFYSQENMDRIQKMIKKTIYEKTKGRFRLDEDQDESDLLISMRAVFLEHSRFLPIKLVHQVKELNKRTVEYIIPDMITEIKQAYAYIKEINEPIKPIPRPVNVNNAGRRTLPALTSAWGF